MGYVVRVHLWSTGFQKHFFARYPSHDLESTIHLQVRPVTGYSACYICVSECASLRGKCNGNENIHNKASTKTGEMKENKQKSRLGDTFLVLHSTRQRQPQLLKQKYSSINRIEHLFPQMPLSHPNGVRSRPANNEHFPGDAVLTLPLFNHPPVGTSSTPPGPTARGGQRRLFPMNA